MEDYYVGPEGPLDAELAIVAEKPGKDELHHLLSRGVGRPLIGWSGGEVDEHLEKVGTSRSRTYLTNAVKRFSKLGNPTTEEVIAQQPDLIQELASLPNLKCIIAMGGVALSSLSNFHLDGILSRRGSVYQSVVNGIKMVPTIHPAFYARGMTAMAPIVTFDIARGLKESKFREYRPEVEDVYLEPTYTEALEWLDWIANQRQISFDIETFYPNYISCIGFACDTEKAFVIPIMKGNRQPYWTVDEEVTIWQGIQRVLAQAGATYITQNGLFDCYHLWRHGILTPYMRNGFDTMYAHRYLAPDFRHRLEFLISIYTDMPYYKDESGKWDSDIRVPDRQFWMYNGKDCVGTLRVAKALIEDLQEYGMLEFYRTVLQRQWDVVAEMQRVGFRIDVPLLNQTRTRLIEEVEQKYKDVEKIFGWRPNSKSPLDWEKILKQYHIPVGPMDRTPKSGHLKTDEDSIAKYARNAPTSEAREAILELIEVTRRRTLTSTFLTMIVDDKDFYHPSYSIAGTDTLRLNSEGYEPAPGKPGGPQLQNIPKKLRKLFLPDHPGWVITQADLKQAEAMVVAWEAEDPLLIEAFESGKDAHRVRACLIYRNWNEWNVPPPELMASIKVVCEKCEKQGEEECRHSERQIAKICGHAFSYLMGLQRMLKQLRGADVFIHIREAERIKNRVVTPSIKVWQDRGLLDLRHSRIQTTYNGAKREFYGELDQDLVRKYLSWRAQTTVSVITDKAMVYAHDNLPGYCKVKTQQHDSILVSHPEEETETVDRVINEAFNQPLVIKGRRLLIPVELKRGKTW